MSAPSVEQVVNAALYEGYILYPYRQSSKKNKGNQCAFGCIYPKDYSDSQNGGDACVHQTECLVKTTGDSPSMTVTVCFLHPMMRDTDYLTAEEKVSGGWQECPEPGESWQEATEREIEFNLALGASCDEKPFASPFFISPTLTVENASGQTAVQRWQDGLEGIIEIENKIVGPELHKVTIRVHNLTPMTADECENETTVLMRTFAFTHTILRATGAEFISLADPPNELAETARKCQNIGAWPVLVGDEGSGEKHTLLSSPIILHDYPQIAPESGGAFLDSAEIDEMPTMADEARLEMRHVDEQAWRSLKRNRETGGINFPRLQGQMPTTPAKQMPAVTAGGRELRRGSAVRIHPTRHTNNFDTMLEGKKARVEAIEEDAEGQIHLALVFGDDPGESWGAPRQPELRFFCDLEDVEPLQEITT
jgi:hypothetical protein